MLKDTCLDILSFIFALAPGVVVVLMSTKCNKIIYWFVIIPESEKPHKNEKKKKNVAKNSVKCP